MSVNSETKFKSYIPSYRTDYFVFDLIERCEDCQEKGDDICGHCSFEPVRLEDALRDIERINSYTNK